MKILFISEYFPSGPEVDTHGGVELRTFYIAQNLAKKHQVVVITSNISDFPVKQYFLNMNVIHVGINRSYNRIGQIVERLIFMYCSIRKGLVVDFDLVEGSSFMGWLPAFVLGKLKNKRKIIVVADISKNYLYGVNKFIYKLFILLEKFLLSRKWDRIICISKTVKNSLKIFKLNSKIIQVIYCGVDKKIIKKNYKKSINKLIITCVARLVPYKRVMNLVKAIHKLSNKYPKIKCNIVGDGEGYNEIFNYIKINKLKKNIIMHGFIKNHTDVLKIINRSYFFCLPSTVEGFGIVTIESLASGVPAILANLPIHHEITHGRGVIFFKSQNYLDLTKKIEAGWLNKKQHQILKNEALSIAKKYTWQKSAQQTQQLYENLCSN